VPLIVRVLDVAFFAGKANTNASNPVSRILGRIARGILAPNPTTQHHSNQYFLRARPCPPGERFRNWA